MRRMYCIPLVLVTFELVAYTAPAPETAPLGGFWGLILVSSVRNSKIREELKLSEDQVKQLEALMAELRETYESFRGMNKEDREKKLQEIRVKEGAAIPKILTRKQLIRAEQIQLQILGPMILTRPEVAASLKLTDEQKEKMALIKRESLKEYRESRAKGEPQKEISKNRNERLLNVLTPAQKEKWKQLLGEPYKRDHRRSEDNEQPSQSSDRPALAK